MLLTSLLLGLSLHAAPASDTYVVVSRRSGVLRSQAVDLAVATREALREAGVPTAALAEDATACAAKTPCLLQRAREKKAAVLVTLDVGSVLDDAVVHAEALSVDEDGLKIAALDVESPMKDVAGSLRQKVAEALAPAIRQHLQLPDSKLAEVTPPEPVQPPPLVAPPPEPPLTPVAEVATTTGPKPSYWNGRRIAGLGVGGAGAVALGAGAVLFGSAAAEQAKVRELCPAGEQCNDAEAYQAYANAARLQNTALVATGIGAAALVGAAVLVLLPSSEAAPPPSAVLVPTPGGAVFSVAGSF
jgi:hypothetical protein